MPAALLALVLALVAALPTEAADRARPIAVRAVLTDYRGSWYTVPTAINNRGQVAGWAMSEDARRVAFLRTRKGRYRTIAANAEATDLNDRGVVVGLRFPCGSRACPPEGFVWHARHGLESLGGFIPLSVNERGDMAGVCAAEDQACVLRDNVVVALAGPGSRAFGINDRSEVVGVYGDNRAFYVSPDWEFVDLGRAEATDINDKGMIAGHRWRDMGERGERAVLTAWTGDRVRSPVRDVSLGEAINKRGWVIANAWDRNERSYSFAWNAVTGERVRIVGGPDEWVEVVDINDRGEIVGTSGLHMVVWKLGE